MIAAHGLRLARLARLGGSALVALALVLPIVSWAVDRSLGREVLLVAPAAPAAVELNRSLWTEGDPVAELYGNPASAEVRVLVTDEARVFRPVEDPSLSIVFSGEGHPRPFQARTLWLFTRLITVGAGVAGLAGIAIGVLLQRSARLANR